VVLALILRGAAKAAIAQTEVTSRIEGISVADVIRAIDISSMETSTLIPLTTPSLKPDLSTLTL